MHSVPEFVSVVRCRQIPLNQIKLIVKTSTVIYQETKTIFLTLFNYELTKNRIDWLYNNNNNNNNNIYL